MTHIFVWTLNDIFGLALLGIFAFLLLCCGIAIVGGWVKTKVKLMFKRGTSA
jgi:hypothetical protein